MNVEEIKRQHTRCCGNGEDVISRRWFAVVNDTIGGYSISPTNQPTSVGHLEVATFINFEAAKHMVRLHNTWLALHVG
jgi:hypothetical protein